MAEYATLRTGAPVSVSEVTEMGLKTFGILARHAKVGGSGPAALKAMGAPVARLGEFLGALAPLELYREWVPEGSEPVTEMDVKAVAGDGVFASGRKGEDVAAGKAVDGGGGWVSGSGKSHHWGARWKERVAVGSVVLEWKAAEYAAEKVELQVGEAAAAGGKEEWRTVAEATLEAQTAAGKPITLTPKGGAVPARGIKLLFTGLPSWNSNNAVGVARLRVFTVRGRDTYSGAADALGQLQGWVAGVADAAATAAAGGAGGAGGGGDAAAALADDSVAALAALVRTSGSLRAALSLVRPLLGAPQRPLGAPAAAAGARLLEALRDEVVAERHRQTEAEYFQVSKAVAGGAGGGPSYGEVVGAAFDPAASSTSGLTFTNNNTTVASASSSNMHVLVNVGPFTAGKAAWTFKLEEDTNSQCACFGAAIKPVTESSYEYSSQLYMYRAYNGNAYTLGSCTRYGSGDPDRVFKGNTVRIEVDFDDGDGKMDVIINDRPVGTMFRGIRGKEIWPAVAFYSSSRKVSLLSVEAPAAVAKSCGLTISGGSGGGGGGGSEAVASGALNPITRCPVGTQSHVPLADLAEEAVAGVDGALGKRGKRGYEVGGVDDVAFGKALATGILSMRPPTMPSESDLEAEAEAASADAAAGATGSGATESKAEPSPSADGAAAAAVVDDEDAGAAAKKAALAAAATETAGAFKHVASAVYWLGSRYDRLTGAVALDDAATAEVRAGAGASPVYFEVYGDGRLLWRSKPRHAARAPSEDFTVSLVGVGVLRLVTRCVAGNAGAFALWVEPTLTTVTEWGCYGWRNDRTAVADALTGLPRGADHPLPSPAALGLTPSGARGGAADDAAASAAWLATSHGLCHGVVVYLGLLAHEYLRGMRSRIAAVGGVAGGDLPCPYAVEPAGDTLKDLAALVTSLTSGTLPAALDGAAAAAIAAAGIRVAAANLRRITVLGVNPAAVGVVVAAGGAGGAGGGAGGGKGKDKDKDKKKGEEAAALSPAVAALVSTLHKLAAWGGAAAGRAVAGGTGGAGGVGAAAEVQAAIWEFLDASRGLTAGSTKAERVAITKALAGPAATVEVQLHWPCEEFDGDGALVQLESVVLQLQLYARALGARARLYGRWPAKAYVLLEVTEEAGGLATFLDTDLPDMLANVDLGDWWASAEGSDALPVRVEASAAWDRRARLAVEPGIGVVRVYPAFVASFDDVAKGLVDFLPAAAL